MTFDPSDVSDWVLPRVLADRARRFPDLALACDPTDLRFTELAIVHGVEQLPVRLR